MKGEVSEQNHYLVERKRMRMRVNFVVLVVGLGWVACGTNLQKRRHTAHDVPCSLLWLGVYYGFGFWVHSVGSVIGISYFPLCVFTVCLSAHALICGMITVLRKLKGE
ncbi:hypothetical protein AAHE18_07G161000 [Arachis hypogaea]